MNTVFLSRRNLNTLLNKLDRNESSRTLIKNDTTHPLFACTTETYVVAVEDEEYYIDREPGPVHPEDEPK